MESTLGAAILNSTIHPCSFKPEDSETVLANWTAELKFRSDSLTAKRLELTMFCESLPPLRKNILKLCDKFSTAWCVRFGPKVENILALWVGKCLYMPLPTPPLTKESCALVACLKGWVWWIAALKVLEMDGLMFLAADLNSTPPKLTKGNFEPALKATALELKLTLAEVEKCLLLLFLASGWPFRGWFLTGTGTGCLWRDCSSCFSWISSATSSNAWRNSLAVFFVTWSRSRSVRGSMLDG